MQKKVGRCTIDKKCGKLKALGDKSGKCRNRDRKPSFVIFHDLRMSFYFRGFLTICEFFLFFFFAFCQRHLGLSSKVGLIVHITPNIHICTYTQILTHTHTHSHTYHCRARNTMNSLLFARLFNAGFHMHCFIGPLNKIFCLVPPPKSNHPCLNNTEKKSKPHSQHLPHQ